ncbi:MAG: hypothetical protein AAGF87_16285 [Bacteroidota bacterium]
MRFVLLLTFLMLFFSCGNDEDSSIVEPEMMDLCEDVNCGVGGDCVNGSCVCASGYSGDRCQIYTSVAVRLQTETPLEIFESGMYLDSLYGKVYAGGMIFYMDVDDFIPGVEGMVLSTEILPGTYSWGCAGTDLVEIGNVTEYPNRPTENQPGGRIGEGRANTEAIVNSDCGENSAAIACAQLSTGGFDDWFLPSSGAIDQVYKNLEVKGHINFGPSSYWTSTERDFSGAWRYSFAGGVHAVVGKSSIIKVRAVRTF